MTATNGNGPRIVVVEADTDHDILEVLEVNGDTIRVRTPLLFEIGEQLSLRITDASGTRLQRVRVTAHTDGVTSLEGES